MMFAGGQAVNKRPSPAAKPLDQSMVHKQIKDSIDGHAVDGGVALQGLIDITGRKWKVITADNIQNPKAVSGNSKSTRH